MAAEPGGGNRTPRWKVVGGRPDPEQLGAVLSPIIESLDPDLVIVFGSAARATMTADSDVDLLVVKDVANVRELGSRARDSLPDRHPPVDVVGATRELLCNHRESLSWVYGRAMAEGIVPYERGTERSNGRRRAWDAVATVESEDERVVRTFRYQREEMYDWLDRARKDMTIVTSKDRSIDPDPRCYSAQAAAEKVLKALLVAHGQPVQAEHDLGRLAEEVRNTGETLPEVATDEKLRRLAEYGGPAQYPGWDGTTTEADEKSFCAIAGELCAHARKRAPEILQARNPRKT